MEREIFISIISDDDMRVVSSYFVKEIIGNNGFKGEIMEKERKKRKKKVKVDRLCREFEIDVKL